MEKSTWTRVGLHSTWMARAKACHFHYWFHRFTVLCCGLSQALAKRSQAQWVLGTAKDNLATLETTVPLSPHWAIPESLVTAHCRATSLTPPQKAQECPKCRLGRVETEGVYSELTFKKGKSCGTFYSLRLRTLSPPAHHSVKAWPCPPPPAHPWRVSSKSTHCGGATWCAGSRFLAEVAAAAPRTVVVGVASVSQQEFY